MGMCPTPQENDPALAKLTACLPMFRLLAGLLASAALAGCGMPAFMSFPPQVRGNKVDDTVLAQLVPGTSTRTDVTALIGSPTARATFDDNTWLYIGEVTKPVIGATNAVLDQQVVVLTFDEKGVLRDIAHKSQQDSVPVAVVSRATPAPGNETTFMQELLGNMGKFSPAPISPDQGRPSGGSPGRQ
jgi:outer membrane protein assembly factor BamE (lipoprotein component of BamABCDE complex)